LADFLKYDLLESCTVGEKKLVAEKGLEEAKRLQM
jgi:hypothetical protein